MRNVLMLLQFALAGMLLVLCLMLFFHDFGKPLQTDEFLVRHRIGGDGVVSLEQLRTWSELIVQKDLFRRARPERPRPPSRGPIMRAFEWWPSWGDGGGPVCLSRPEPTAKSLPAYYRAGGTLMKDVTWWKYAKVRRSSANLTACLK